MLGFLPMTDPSRITGVFIEPFINQSTTYRDDNDDKHCDG